VTSDAKVGALAQRQHGLISRGQARWCGLGDDAVEWRLAAGRWLVFRRGVYVIAGAPTTERQAVMAALLAAGDGVMASHLTAARLWGLDLPSPDRIDVVGRHLRLTGVRSHQSGTLVAADAARVGGIRLTSPARTFVDCAKTVAGAELGPAVDDALRRGLVKLADLRRCHERVDTGPGRRPTLAMREVLLERRPGHAPGDSRREADIVRLLARTDLPAPVLGHRVSVGRRTYKLDIAWPEVKRAIEFDGWDTHRTFTAFHGDRQRTRRIVAAGWTILPVSAKTDLHELIGDLVGLFALDRARAG
jgi:hypothetical protein